MTVTRAAATRTAHSRSGSASRGRHRSKRIACFGDSITWTATSYRQKLGQLLGPYAALTNKGCSGQKTSDLLQRITSDYPGPYRPQDTTGNLTALFADTALTSVFVLIGVNDVNTGVAAATVIANLTSIYQQILAQGLELYVATILPFGAAAGFTGAKETARLAVNAFIASYAGAAGIASLDGAMGSGSGPVTLAAAYDSGDGIHPNYTGYDVLASAIFAQAFAGSPV